MIPMTQAVQLILHLVPLCLEVGTYQVYNLGIHPIPIVRVLRLLTPIAVGEIKDLEADYLLLGEFVLG